MSLFFWLNFSLGHFYLIIILTKSFPFTGFPNTTKLLAITEAIASSPFETSSISLPPSTEAAAKKGEKTKKNKKRSSDSSDAPVEAKNKKMIVVRVRKSSRKASSAYFPGSKSLYQLKDYPEDDDDMEFITHKPIDIELELASPKRDARKVESPLARGLQKDQVTSSSQEAPLFLRKIALENTNVIHV